MVVIVMVVSAAAAVGTVVVRLRLRPSIALHGNPSQSCGASLAIWDHSVLPATRHK